MLFKNSFKDPEQYSTDRELFTSAIQCCNLTQIWETQNVGLPPPLEKILRLLKNTLEDCYTVKDTSAYRKISVESFLNTMETEMDIDLSTTLYRDQLLEWQKESVKGCKRKLITTTYRDWETDRKSTRLNSSHITRSRMPSSA